MDDRNAVEQWREDRTTFQRVYDVVLGSQSVMTAQDVAERAECSETGARKALDQLAEMGIAERQEGRPVGYRRNDAYLTWKRVESLARDHSPDELRQRVDELMEEDGAFQERYGVPEPDAVAPDDRPVGDHDAIHDLWDDLGEWRTIRRDIRVLRRAVRRAETGVEDGLRA